MDEMYNFMMKVKLLLKLCVLTLLFLACKCSAGWTDALIPGGDKSGQALRVPRAHSNLRDSSISNSPSSNLKLPRNYFDKGDDLRFYLNPSLSSDALQRIASQLREGMVVVIRNAMDPLLAEAVFRELNGADYALDQDFHAAGSHYSFHRLMQYDSKLLNQTFALFNDTSTRKWMSDLSSRDCMGDTTVRGEYYAKGDHTLPTTDFVYQRTVAFDWHLSKDWKPEWGGALYWCQEVSDHAYIHPSFNTLILYSVTKDTSHFVTPVSDEATEKRLSISGWFNSDWIPNASDNYEEILTKWKNNMTEFQYMAVNFVISSDSFDSNKKQRVVPLLLEIQESQARGYEEIYEFGEEDDEISGRYGEEARTEDGEWDLRDLTQGDL